MDAILGMKAGDGHTTQFLGASLDGVPALLAVMRPQTRMPGTLAHELLHVLVHRDFPNVPLWLDEGVAALVETAELAPPDSVGRRRFVPLPNWRGRVLLKSKGFGVPQLKLLLTPGTLDQQARLVTTHATDEISIKQRDELSALARYFVYFLWERDALPQVYRTLRDRNPYQLNDGGRIALLNRPGANDVLALVAEVLHAPPAQVTREFKTWLAVTLAKTPKELRC
jgi:hypothetical protein